MLTPEQGTRHLRQAHAEAEAAIRPGHLPLGALWLAADGKTVPLRQGNLDVWRAR